VTAAEPAGRNILAIEAVSGRSAKAPSPQSTSAGLGKQPEQRVFKAAAGIRVEPADRPFDPDHHGQKTKQYGGKAAAVPAEHDANPADQLKGEGRPRQQRRDTVLRQQRFVGVHAAPGFQKRMHDPVDPDRHPQQKYPVFCCNLIHVSAPASKLFSQLCLQSGFRQGAALKGRALTRAASAARLGR
jgi:hypothetical protein